MEDPRRVAPAAERNKQPILEALRDVLPARGLVLELGSGSGQHVVHFARAFPTLEFQPSDPEPAARRSIEAWVRAERLPNVRAPLALDAEAERWTEAPLQAVLAINVIHISPWPVTQAIFEGAARHLSEGGLLFLYGPYRRGGLHTAPSNEAFDHSLRARDPRWGVRDLEEVTQVGREVGLVLEREVAMPANNLSLVFRRPGLH